MIKNAVIEIAEMIAWCVCLAIILCAPLFASIMIHGCN